MKLLNIDYLLLIIDYKYESWIMSKQQKFVHENAFKI